MARIRQTDDDIRARAVPLDDFSASHRTEIMHLVEQPKPPPRWIKVIGAELPNRAWFEWYWQRGLPTPGFGRRRRLDVGLRAAVLNRDGYVCGLCGGAVEPDDVHIDHIVPWSLGGSDDPDNLQVAHSACNIRKGNNA